MPQHDRLALATLHTPKKYLLWSYILAETDRRFPVKRFNAQRCKYILISMNNTRVRQLPSTGRFEKDKRSERNDSAPQPKDCARAAVQDKARCAALCRCARDCGGGEGCPSYFLNDCGEGCAAA